MPSDQLKRRDFITLLGGAATAWPLEARAQQPAMPVIGFLNGASAWEYAYLVDAFRQGLSETGYVEGRNVLVEYRWAESHYDRLPTLAADLVRRQVTVIAAAGGTQPAVAARAATTTIPIVFSIGADPVAAGLVTSLNRPGGNLTGVVTLAVELGPKRLELAHELVPAASSVALLVNPSDAAQTDIKKAQEAARALGLQLNILRASSERELDTAFATVVQLRAGALVINADAFFNSRSKQLAQLALSHAAPTVYQYREFAAAGGLASYGSRLADAYREVGIYTGRILKGNKPAELPVQQMTRAELIINLKTANALGLTVPLPLLGRADELIE
jgi:putative tryptophan/tyrosine transport system substrate-binding protein